MSRFTTSIAYSKHSDDEGSYCGIENEDEIVTIENPDDGYDADEENNQYGGLRQRRHSLGSTSVLSDDGNEGDDDESSVARRKLLMACALIFVFMTIEGIGGIVSGSLAIMTDALHLLTDLVGFGISIAALTLSRRPATRKLTFGWYRAEILGALISVILVWAITAVLVMLAIQRLAQNEYEIDAHVMLITSSLGVGINLFMGVQLQHGHSHGPGHGHSHGGGGDGHDHSHEERRTPEVNNAKTSYGAISESAEQSHQGEPKIKKGENINVRAAIMNMLGDLCQSVGVMIAALIIFFKPEWKIADPITTFLFSIFVLSTTIHIMRDVFHILMEGTPRGVDFDRMKKDILKIDGVSAVHHVRIWALTASKIAMAAHIEYTGFNYGGVLRQCRHLLRKTYGIDDLTLQVEVEPPSVSLPN